MRAGRLPHRITILKPKDQGTQNAYGEVTTPYVPLATVWASIEPVSAKDVDLAKSYAATISHKVTIRYYPNLSTTHRLQYGSRIFHIDGIINTDEANRELSIYCTEKAK